MSKTPTVAISIATHNRKDDLQNTLHQLAKLQPAPKEVIIGADNCSDGTVEWLRDQPQYKLIVNTEPKGSIETRDSIVAIAEADIILSLDDDSYPVEQDFLQRLVEVFQSQPEVGLVTFPQRSEEYPESLTQKDFGLSMWVGSYPNSGAAFRKALYDRLPGYPKFFFHAYEEPDFALQLWSSGSKVLFYTELTIRHHWTSVQRNENRTHRRHARNECLSMFIRCPGSLLLPLVLFRGFRQFCYAAKRGISWVLKEPLWWKEVWALLPKALVHRQPLPFDDYWRWMQLVRKPQVADMQKSEIGK